MLVIDSPFLNLLHFLCAFKKALFYLEDTCEIMQLGHSHSLSSGYSELTNAI